MFWGGNSLWGMLHLAFKLKKEHFGSGGQRFLVARNMRGDCFERRVVVLGFRFKKGVFGIERKKLRRFVKCKICALMNAIQQAFS
ncbi:hypothetical protein TNIN_143311 [Trichonephila inaurata madagascariensis]|uniref:Uncharacterized protein n=1 Tax=Trichonephila inaurata madagascariensis TaxID=2747483 RepID=A0A8X6XMK7_9ARAC|nr:hypothetical protein TNIN_143311 [Trichonephila inaurata madagascariensis]